MVDRVVTVREAGPEYWIRNTQTHIGMLTKMNVHLKKEKHTHSTTQTPISLQQRGRYNSSCNGNLATLLKMNTIAWHEGDHACACECAKEARKGAVGKRVDI